MKKILLLLATLFIYVASWCQTPIGTMNNEYSNWLFVNSDKALQVRYKQVKLENEIGYFEVQFKINFDDQIFCSHPTCLGYLFVFSYPTLDNMKSIEKSYKFYNSFKGIYTLSDTIPIKLFFPDGSKRILREEGFFYTTDNNNTEMSANFFSNCVDDILSNNPNYHRCKPYKSNFIESEAIMIK